MCTAWITALTPCQTSVKLFCLEGRAAPSRNGPSCSLVLFLASFLAASLARQRFFHSLSFAGLQVERMTFYFLDNVLGLYLPFEPAKRVFQRFTFLKSNFCQRDCTPLPVLAGLVQLCQATPS